MSPGVQVWVCDVCSAVHWPQVVEAATKCPSCGNPTGKLETRKPDPPK